MSYFLKLNVRFHIDSGGKLRVTTKGNICDTYVVDGFKLKLFKKKNYLFPILKNETP